MNVNHEELIIKLKEFWLNNEKKDFTIDDLKKVFNYQELGTIVADNNFRDRYQHIVNRFLVILRKYDKLFTDLEAEKLIEFYPDNAYIIECLTDEKILSLVSDADYNKTISLAYDLKSDEAKIKGFKKVKSPELKMAFIRSLQSDELKIKYLKYITNANKSDIIATFKDESLMEQHMTFFIMNKGIIIKKFKEDSKKIKYFKEYYWILSNEDKEEILTSLANTDALIECLKSCGDKVKADVIRYRGGLSNELIDQIISSIHNQKELANLLAYNDIPEYIKIKNVSRITDKNLFTEVVENLTDKNKVQFLDNIPIKKRIEIIKDMTDFTCLFDALSTIENNEDIISIISHIEHFPEYKSDYQYILDLYAYKYNLNKEHLYIMATDISLYVLKVIENPNIVKIINSKPEEFKVIMELFKKNSIEMNSASMNDILNALLQRSFRINHSDVILTFPIILNAIENKDIKILTEKLHELSTIININEEIMKYNWGMKEFTEQLLTKNQTAIDCLHNITNKYVRNERNQYIKDNLNSSLEQIAIAKYDKNDLMKYFIANYTLDVILNCFPMISSADEEYYKSKYTEEEMRFLKNRDIIKKIIEFKKNPSSYENIPVDIKENMKYFNSVFEKSVSNRRIESFPDIKIDRKLYEFKSADSEFMINIMMYLDLDKLRADLLKNSELQEKLIKFWSQYKLGGWGNTFDSILSQTGIVVDPEIVANFIQYFGLSYANLEEKIAKGELANISITSLIDLAACYSMESKKYSMVFGADNFRFIASNPGPNSSSMLKEERIKKAVSLLQTVRNRQTVTVPPMDKNFILSNGKSLNVVVGNVRSITNLTLGERTGACMRIGGAGNSLFEFCLENENGFHIVFNNPVNGNFVSRVSGFRNGNTVFLNELRYSKDSNYTNKDVVEACKQVSAALIENSKNSSVPIDNVVITPYYAMGESSMTSQNIGIEEPQQGMKKFYTDVSSNSIILATSNTDNKLVPFKPGNKNVPRYKSQREKQKMLYNTDCVEYVAHLESLDRVLSGERVDNLEVEQKENLIACLAGEDWCVTLDKDGNINSFVMQNTSDKERAIQEAKEALEYMKINLANEMAISEGMKMGM